MTRSAMSAGSGLPCQPSFPSTSAPSPLPLSVRATMAVGAPRPRVARRSAVVICVMSWPSMTFTRQPKAAKRRWYALRS